jgi:hypothetical protein
LAHESLWAEYACANGILLLMNAIETNPRRAEQGAETTARRYPRLLTVKQVAARLGLTLSGTYSLERGSIPSSHLKRESRVGIYRSPTRT